MKKDIKIGIDARVLQTGFANKGIGTYDYNLIKNLIKLNTNFQFSFYVFNNSEIPDIIKNEKLIKLHRHKKFNIFYQQFITLKNNIDVFHNLLSIGPTPEIVLPFFQFKKTIGTVFDLTFYKLPDKWSQFISNTKDYRLQIHALKKAQRVISISSYVKDDLIKTFAVPGKKVVAVHGGVDLNIFKPLELQEELEHIKNKYNIKNNFILGVGDVGDYKKNIKTLFKLIEFLPDFKLVIAGNPGNIKNSNPKIIFVGEVSQQELTLLYNLASVFVFPSFAEGLGFPVLEAMASGCPVIASDRTSLPEILGDAGMLVAPSDIKGMMQAIKTITGNNEFRQDIIHKGLKRAKVFSWENCAKKTMQLYEEIA
ncbi:MAG: glycosyltransferase family 1 protein [bacterium]|nr:glycosyltransferase family 1 protein [bacterium]